METLTALGLLRKMPMHDRMALFHDVLGLCLSQKFGQAARQIVLSMPREWLVGNIAAAARPLLERGDDLDFLMMIGLFERIDRSLATELACQAAASDDYDIREVGNDYLRVMSNSD